MNRYVEARDYAHFLHVGAMGDQCATCRAATTMPPMPMMRPNARLATAMSQAALASAPRFSPSRRPPSTVQCFQISLLFAASRGHSQALARRFRIGIAPRRTIRLSIDCSMEAMLSAVLLIVSPSEFVTLSNCVETKSDVVFICPVCVSEICLS